MKVRLAGLWELPAGQQAIERAPSEAIKDAGDHLVVGHTDLDKRARDVAAKLGVELPNQPTEQQQGWLRELSAASGEEYERKFANLLRNRARQGLRADRPGPAHHPEHADTAAGDRRQPDGARPHHHAGGHRIRRLRRHRATRRRAGRRPARPVRRRRTGNLPPAAGAGVADRGPVVHLAALDAAGSTDSDQHQPSVTPGACRDSTARRNLKSTSERPLLWIHRRPAGP